MKCLHDVLLSMAHMHLNAKLSVEVLCQVLSGINTAVLATRASKGEHQVGEPPLKVT